LHVLYLQLLEQHANAIQQCIAKEYTTKKHAAIGDNEEMHQLSQQEQV
jgi:hypothetical protein